MAKPKVTVICPTCLCSFERYLFSVAKAIGKNGFWQCKKCSTRKCNKDRAKKNFMIRKHKQRGRQQIKVGGKWLDLHRYIMEKYLGRSLDHGEIVHHLDGDKSNNKISNLEIMLSPKHTYLHHKGVKRSCETGYKISQRSRQSSVLSKEDVVRIRSSYKPYKNTMTSLAEQYGVSRAMIQRIIENKTWKEVSI